jgi:hypothetical protein
MPDVPASLADLIAKIIDLWCDEHPDLTIRQICDAFDEILACCKGMDETALANKRHEPRKVHHLGIVPANNAAPQPSVVNFMRRMLDKAESGEMQGVALAYARQTGMPTEAFECGTRPGDFWIVGAALLALQHRFGAIMNAEENCVEVTPPKEPA